MAIASYRKQIHISSDNNTFTLLPTTSADLTIDGDELDTTEMGKNIGYKTSITGLLHWSIDLDINLEPGDAAISTVQDALLARKELYIRYMPTNSATVGYTGKVSVGSTTISGDVAGLETMSVTLTGASALTTLS